MVEDFASEPSLESVPSCSALKGFHHSMLVPDMLHVWNLGVARDLVACSLKTILQSEIVFQGANIKVRMKEASESLRAFAKEHACHLRLRKLTKAKLTWKSRRYPELCASGYDSFVVGVWLEQLLQPHHVTYPEICSMLWSSNKAVSLMYSADFFLTASEKSTLETLGNLFTKIYLKMANKAISEGKMMWRIRPKWHMFCHTYCSPRVINPGAYSTWMDEDSLKKLAKVLNVVNCKTAPKRVLQRWALALPEYLKRTLGEP